MMNCGLRHSIFERATLRNLDYSGSDLSEANFEFTNLEAANFYACNLYETNFANSNLALVDKEYMLLNGTIMPDRGT